MKPHLEGVSETSEAKPLNILRLKAGKGGEIFMAVQNVGEHYKCSICGNGVAVTKVGGGTLVCCGQEMQLVDIKEQKPIDDELPV